MLLTQAKRKTNNSLEKVVENRHRLGGALDLLEVHYTWSL